jgi:hypothetical protein
MNYRLAAFIASLKLLKVTIKTSFFNSLTKLNMRNSFDECLHPEYYYNGANATSLLAVMEPEYLKAFFSKWPFTSKRRIPSSADNKRL